MEPETKAVPREVLPNVSQDCHRVVGGTPDYYKETESYTITLTLDDDWDTDAVTFIKDQQDVSFKHLSGFFHKQVRGGTLPTAQELKEKCEALEVARQLGLGAAQQPSSGASSSIGAAPLELPVATPIAS